MSENSNLESWGRFPKVSHRGELLPNGPQEVQAKIGSVDSLILPRGLGRSYGDCCLNAGGYLLSTRLMNRFISFDQKEGILCCESGVSLDEILRIFVPKGWFLPVTPGTKYVTVGGAIANDIHGKNHHIAGSFGNHVIEFELQRSDVRVLCSMNTNADLFRATVGGLGLTGVVLMVRFKLRRITGPYVDMESIKFSGVDEFYQISRESGKNYEYTVSWLDCLTDSEGIHGIFMRGNHSELKEDRESRIVHNNPAWQTFPFDAPSFLLSPVSIRIFNYLYYNKQRKIKKRSRIHYEPFFYPLDKINRWNRMYGKRGFLQWQCVVPESDGNRTIRLILQKITKSKLGSFLVVLKEFGNIRPEGMMSFPMPGITLAVDFPNSGPKLFSLFKDLDNIVAESGGRIYPAKDARMSSYMFRATYKELENFMKYIDPRFSSSFYRRVMEGKVGDST